MTAMPDVSDSIEAARQIAGLRELVTGTVDPTVALNRYFALVDDGLLEEHERKPVSRARCRAEYPGLLETVSGKLSGILGPEGGDIRPVLMEIPAFGLVHGSCFLNGFVLSFPLMYLSCSRTGMFAMETDGKPEVFRFVVENPD